MLWLLGVLPRFLGSLFWEMLVADLSASVVLRELLAACIERGAHTKLVPSILALFTPHALTDGTHAQQASALIEHNCLPGECSSSMDSMVAEKALARAFRSLVINFAILS